MLPLTFGILTMLTFGILTMLVGSLQIGNLFAIIYAGQASMFKIYVFIIYYLADKL